jgi:Glycosyltransferase family 87
VGRLLTPAAVAALVVLTVFDVALCAAALTWQIGTDFRMPYAAGEIARSNGWQHIYDIALQRPAVLGLGHSDLFYPYLNAPPWAFLVWPLTFLPYPVAYAICVASMTACLLAAALLAAPSDRRHRIIYVGSAFGSLEIALGPGFGQPAALVALGIVGCWWLLRADRPVLAGLALALISVKPNIAILVPAALLLAGHTRAFIYWAAATLALAAVSVVAVQASGVQDYVALLATGPTYLANEPAWTLSRLLGPRVGLPLEVLVLIGAIAAVWLYRRQGPEVPIAVGIVATLIVSPYMHTQDLVVLVVAIWMLHRARLEQLNGRVLAGFWVAAIVGIEWTPLLVATEVVLIGVLLYPVLGHRRALVPAAAQRPRAS